MQGPLSRADPSFEEWSGLMFWGNALRDRALSPFTSRCDARDFNLWASLSRGR